MKKIRLICSILIVVLVLGLLQKIVMPKYMGDPLAGDILEGTFVSEYYKTDKDFDVIFVGDCELYENISPQVLWDEYGINSYIRGSAQQLIWQSYYLMEETIKYQKPEVIVFNVLSMKYNEPQKETYNRMTLDYMKWSKTKVDDIKASMLEDEHFVDYALPLLRYHSRALELTSDDFKYMFDRDVVTFNGYYMRCDSLAAKDVPEGRPLADYEFGSNAYDYLNRMVKLCKDNDVELVLVKAPSLYPYWYDEWDQQMENFAEEHDLKYYNFLNDIDEIGLDFEVDTYDGGLHLNCQGAEKMSHYFGRILSEECHVPDRRGDESMVAKWNENRIEYEAEKQRQNQLIN